MKKFYLTIQIFFLWGILHSNIASGQLTATSTGYESRCEATGAIKILATGGSGSYQYKVNKDDSTFSTNFTNLDSITGLSYGFYLVTVNDIVNNTTFTQDSVFVPGTYQAPSFFLNHTDVSCDNGYNGSITVSGLILNGRAPFVFSIVAPSTMDVGTSNSTGVFTGLGAGNYSIQMTDSCGAIQTRIETINNYTWSINSYSFTKTDCKHATGYITITDSKGNNSQFTTIPGFTYGAVLAPGDTIWSANGNFNNIVVTGVHSLDVFAKDACGNIKKVTLSIFLTPSIDANVSITKACNDFSASVTGITNFFGANFYLYNSSDVQIAQDTTGTFTNIPYGSYCIKANDACTDTTITRCFTATAPVASVSNNVSISNKTCTSFTASITGQNNLTSPQYCIVNSSTGVTDSCNATGQFNNLSYGSYCISIKDVCIDTTITRCFSASRPTPTVNPVIVPSYVTCTNFGLNINNNSDSLTNPTFCLYDVNHVLVGSCNSTGIFDSIPLGSYCVSIHDACLDTTITRCFNVGAPTIVNNVNINLSNQACSTFTATATASNLTNPDFCLFSAVDSSLITCNTTGVFNSLAYGNYYIKSTDACPDTTMINSFSVSRPLPSVNPNVSISNRSCTTFSAQITGQQNLISPTYCLINTVTNDTLGCSSSSSANNIPYGSYIVSIVSGCNDTLKVPFSQYPDSLILTATATISCNLGYSKFNINVNGILPVNIQIYTPDDSLLKDSVYNATNFSIDNIPNLDSAGTYMIIGTDGCGTKDTIYLAPKVSYLSHIPTVTPLCPGSVWLNGSGNINTTVSTNLSSSLSVSIILKNGGAVSLNPDYASGSNYTFNNLGPGTYVIQYKTLSGCIVSVYDTVTISTYQYPDLSKTTAYQCDNNGFSVGAVASYGVGPFSYQIIGSEPSIPDLTSPPQASPIFNINNGTTYSLIRLRALDACGNATLGDVGILPLSNNGIQSTENCFENPTTLSVDTIYNASYSWFLKSSENATDSVAVSNGYNYYIASVLPSDTGVYVCHISVDSGCINRTYYYNLNGSCYSTLAFSLQDFSGNFADEKVLLNWAINNTNDLSQIIVERKTNINFAEIGEVSPHLPSQNNQYQFTDPSPGSQNYYRLKLVKQDNSFTYSNIIFLQKQFTSGISIYPNPVNDILNVEFYQTNNHTYKIFLLNILNQKLKEIIFNTANGNKLQIKRDGNMNAGIYILQFIDMNTNEEFSQKVILGPR